MKELDSRIKVGTTIVVGKEKGVVTYVHPSRKFVSATGIPGSIRPSKISQFSNG